MKFGGAKEERERTTSSEKQKKPFREEMKNQKEYGMLGIFSEKLSKAGNSHDKNDYKLLKNMLTEISKGHLIEELYPNNRDNLKTITAAQKTETKEESKNE